MQNGHALESAVIAQLRKSGCGITTCDHWDHGDKIDFRVTSIDGRRLSFPIEVQITRQLGNTKKMAAFLRRVQERSSAHLRTCFFYIELADGVASLPDSCLGQLRSLFRFPQSRDKAGDIRGIWIGPEGAVKTFWVAERLQTLRSEHAAQAASPSRCHGRIHLIKDTGCILEADDGARYWSYDRMFARGEDRRSIQAHRRGGIQLSGQPVSFFPTEEGKPYRLAMSVTFD